MIRSSVALRALYERYRTARADELRKTSRGHGEWLAIAPGSEAARLLQEAFGVSPDHASAQETVRAEGPINGQLGVLHERDVRTFATRDATRSRTLLLKFALVTQGASRVRSEKSSPRGDLPAVSEQLDWLYQSENRGPQTPILYQLESPNDSVDSSSGTHVGTDLGGVDFSMEDEVALVLPDGSPLPDLSTMLLPHELVELWERGKLNDTGDIDSVFEHYYTLLEGLLEEDEEVDVAAMVERFRATLELQSGTPPIGDDAARPTGTWAEVSGDVVSWTRREVRRFVEHGLTGQLLVLSPSPGTGKSRGMMLAAADAQEARKRVGYAVLSRSQIPEVEARLRASGPNVRLHVIEGRHAGNCSFMDQIDIATASGFSPGSTVCPTCPLYPSFSGRTECGYYKARIEASRDRYLSGIYRRPAAIILTTHASAMQGASIVKRRYQNFWEFDTLFIDEDPTSSLVVQYEIASNSLTYRRSNSDGVWTGPTFGTIVLEEAIAKATRERKESFSKGFVDPLGGPHKIHTRDHGSSYAGQDLHMLLESVAREHGHTLRSLSAAVIDGMSGDLPEKGEIMSLSAEEVASAFPNRYLLALYATVAHEMSTIADAYSHGVALEPAYRVHLDLTEDEDGQVVAVYKIHDVRPYAGERTNLVIGDAYADIAHYEALFGRFRHEGRVRTINHRAVWPRSSSLIRMVTHAGTKHIQNHTQLITHCETKLRPILELERGRRVVFYIHLAMKSDFDEWMREVGNEFELAEYAIEHWGSGRGKDIYRDFHTFIAVTEYVPNMGALVHEANTVAALASPGNTRIEHWSSRAARKGSTTFANSLTNTSPFLQAAFHRKATDELAQAVHRIRPAMPAPDGLQKRAYVLGHMVPWTDELVTATAATVVLDNGDIETERLGSGARFTMTQTLSLITAREVAGAIAEVFHHLGCWSHCFAHCLLGVPNWACVESTLAAADSGRPTEGGRSDCFNYNSGEQFDPPREGETSRLVDRVLGPPKLWRDIVQKLNRSAVYTQGVKMWSEGSDVGQVGWYRPFWCELGARGYQFWGDQARFDAVLASYAPTAERVPF